MLTRETPCIVLRNTCTHRFEGGVAHVVALVDGVEQVVVAQLLHVVGQGQGVPQLQQDGLHEDQRGSEEVDEVSTKVLRVVQKQFDSVHQIINAVSQRV